MAGLNSVKGRRLRTLNTHQVHLHLTLTSRVLSDSFRESALYLANRKFHPFGMVSQLQVSPSRPALVSPHSHPLLRTLSGTVQVFTAPHRSFFTNVMVQAMRAAGQGVAVLVVQFLKGGLRQGTHQPMQLGQQLDWLRADIPRCIHGEQVSEAERTAIANLWTHTQAVVMQGSYSLVVLDELSLALGLGLLAEADVLHFLEQRPPQVDVVLTGPDMPECLLAIADQVTECRRQFMA
jgi:cob(I)alamin adenosyltransferase